MTNDSTCETIMEKWAKVDMILERGQGEKKDQREREGKGRGCILL